MKNYGTESEILLDQQAIAKMIIIRNISKANLISWRLYNMIIVFRSIFHEGNKYYPQNFLGECLYKLNLKYDRIYVSDEIDGNKANGLRESIVCHYR